MTLIEKFNEIAELANVAPIPEVFGLSGITGLDINNNSVYNVTKEEVINDLDCSLDNEI